MEFIKDIKTSYKKALVQEGLFTPNHTKFVCQLSYKNNVYVFDYQCNIKYNKPNKNELLGCLVNDYKAFESCKVSDNDDENIEEFGYMFGYESIKELLKAYRGCKKTYEALNNIFTSEEIDNLYSYCEEKGTI